MTNPSLWQRLTGRTLFERIAALASLVVLAAILSLTIMSFRAAARQRATAAALVRGISGWVGQRYATTIGNNLYVAANVVFAKVGLGRWTAGTAGPSLASILEAADGIASCNCAAVLRVPYAFAADFEHHTLRILGRGRGVADAASLEQIGRAMGELLTEPGWGFAVLPSLDPGGRFLFVARHPAGGPVYYGFAADSASVISKILNPYPARRAELVARLSGVALTPASIFLRVSLPDGTVLGESHPGPLPSDTVTITLGTVMGTLRVDAAILEPDRSALAGGPLAGSPLPLSMLLAVLGALAIVMLWWSARRAVALAGARATLTSALSHELRTPLTQILLYSELIQRGRYPDAGGLAAATDVVIREARRLLRLISNALELAANGDGRARSVPVALGPVIESAIADYRLLAAEQGTTLTPLVQGHPVVAADADAIRQIVINLVDNAVRYGPPQGVVTVGAAVSDGEVELYVEDSGPGIPEAQRERVWEPFVRLPGAAHRTGSGIGLAVVRQLAVRYQGRVAISGAEGGGSRVLVRFPVASAGAEADVP